jgi:glyoxylase-like metal-dependent hydrolase (beta-lactamase superfamily II)
VYTLQDLDVVFSGDLIFRQSVGRTDLEGGNQLLLIRSIKDQIFTLPANTRLLSGHGPETTVGYEQKYNPYL